MTDVAPAGPVVATVVDWEGTEPPQDLLGEGERRYADCLPPWRRREWSGGRLAARAALRLLAGDPVRPVEILRGADGAPAVAGGELACSLSITHSRTLAACAVAVGTGPLGVDVEFDGRGIDRLIPRIASPGEDRPEGPTATVVWACKEAALKACKARPARMSAYRVRLEGEAAQVTPLESPGLPRPTAWIEEVPGGVAVVAACGARRPRWVHLTARQAVRLLTGGADAPQTAGAVTGPGR